MKLALLPGHARKKEGAACCAGYYKDFGEWALARVYLPSLAETLRERGLSVQLTQREDAGGTSPRYSARAANATGADIALEWHFNSAAPTTQGCEVLYWHKSANGKRFASLLSERLADLLGVPNRGAKPIGADPDERGYSAFRESRMPFFMVEPCFAGSNPREAELFGNLIKSGHFARAAGNIVADALGIVYGLET